MGRRRKKKFAPLADVCSQAGGAVTLFFRGRRPTYFQFFGLWLNKRRIWFRQSGTVAFGASVALGIIEPGSEYWDSLTDGDGEAKLMKTVFKIGQKNQNRKMS